MIERKRWLCAAALTILRGYHVAGRPRHGGSRIGSFEEWDDLIRGAVVWAFDADPAAGRERVRLEADPDLENMTALLAAWRAVYPGEEFVALKDVADRARRDAEPELGNMADSTLLDALTSIASREKGGPDLRRIGYRLRAWKGRIAGGLRLDKGTKGMHGARWKVVRVQHDGGGMTI